MRLGKDATRQFANIVIRGLLTKDKEEEFAKLYRLARKLHRTYEIDCNVCDREKHPAESWENYDKARELQMRENEKNQARIERKIDALCSALGVSHYLQRDPRGMPLYLGVVDKDRYTDGVAVG